MDYIQYDPERILNGFTEDILKELAKKLKRKIRATNSEIIQEILAPPKGKPEERVKIWQEINRFLRKELETFTQGECLTISPEDTPLEEQFKLGYMLTLSTNPELREMGEKLYCQAQENLLEKEVEKEETVTPLDEITAGETVEMIDYRNGEKTIEAKSVIEIRESRDISHTIEASGVIETFKDREADGTIEDKDVESLKNGEIIGAIGAKCELKQSNEDTNETEQLQKKIRILENRLRKANSEVLRTKGQLEKLRIDIIALKSQVIKEKEETGKYRNRVKDLEEEREEKEKEIELLRQKLEQRKTLPPQKVKEQLHIQRKDSLQIKDELCGQIDLASYQGRKALIFAERDNEIDIRLNAIGIIPIWAMEIDWNRPRRRMSTCEIVLYKMNDKRLKKLDEIRDIARYWNIPCNEILNI